MRRWLGVPLLLVAASCDSLTKDERKLYEGTFGGSFQQTSVISSPTGQFTCVHSYSYTGTLVVSMKDNGATVEGESDVQWSQAAVGLVSGDASRCGTGNDNVTIGLNADVGGTIDNVQFSRAIAGTASVSFTGELVGQELSGTLSFTRNSTTPTSTHTSSWSTTVSAFTEQN